MSDHPDKYSNKPARIEAVRAWRDAAIADGWRAAPIYDTEPMESAARLSREGWEAQVYSRDRGPEETREPRFKGYIRYEADVHVWAPDAMAIHKVPEVYDWQKLTAGARTCGYCGATDVDTDFGEIRMPLREHLRQ